ncbi:spermatogenesis-associated protein 17 [Oncorhynchus tshawytscha]|uniref:Spermatogenesis associated 17 n=1 Tax=Oncorhynchus tshawytscha TaxID=74940 RepID=A0AAZ3SFX8_ONCTS|nr:spermatogenesis-associated protein 17 [Oncorhynchus tshawytscha]
MASLVRLQNEIERIKEEYFTRNRIAEENRQRENEAAILIQSWFRGCQVRAYLSHLHRKATIIQKIWRGFTARAHFRQMVKAAYFIMKMNFYHEMSVRIQQRWRGYCVRKYSHNYYARKRYMEGLARKNKQIRRDLEEFSEFQRRERERMAMEREEQEKNVQAQRMHFLLSTKQCPGVFNSPFRPGPDEMELRLRRTKPLPPRNIPRDRASLLGNASPSSPSFPGVPRAFGAKPLPPIPSKKPQGPFRGPEEVWAQRQRGLEPSLRVQTSISDLEQAQDQLRSGEWRNHTMETMFQPFSKAHQNRSYERMLHTSSSFQPVPYGTKHFREEHQENLQGKQPFKTVFTTCHVFDKFGRLYSNAGKIV